MGALQGFALGLATGIAVVVIALARRLGDGGRLP